MLRENEVVMLILGVGMMILFILNQGLVKKIKSWKFLFGGYCFLLLGCFFTVLEGFIWEGLLNVLEHLCYAGSAFLLIAWSLKYSEKVQEEEAP
jgi:hypothetical protein